MIVTELMSCRFGIRAPLHTCWDSIILPEGSFGPGTGSLRRTDLPLPFRQVRALRQSFCFITATVPVRLGIPEPAE